MLLRRGGLMSRLMYDAIGANAGLLVPFAPVMVAGYDTGSPDIVWGPRQWQLFPGAVKVHIDQGGAGAPSHTATVQDVETHAWSVTDIPGWVAACTAERPTTYCARENLAGALWASDAEIWLAWPGWMGQRLDPALPAVAEAFASGRVVAVQDVFNGHYDRSRVLDPDWPHRPSGVPVWQEDAMRALPTLAAGARGEDVRTVQALCNARADVPVLSIDGIFGSRTESQVRAMQSLAKIPVDGIVGPQTWPVLMGVV